MLKLQKDQEITLVSKGIVRIFTTSYVDVLRKGKAFFIKITKVGRKYLYGTHIFFDVDGRHDREWIHKFLMEDYIIHDGIREDLCQKHKDFVKVYEEHKNSRKEFRRDKERESQDWLNRQMEHWDTIHPRLTFTL